MWVCCVILLLLFINIFIFYKTLNAFFNTIYSIVLKQKLGPVDYNNW